MSCPSLLDFLVILREIFSGMSRLSLEALCCQGTDPKLGFLTLEMAKLSLSDKI